MKSFWALLLYKYMQLITGIANIPWYKILLSYIKPVWVKKAASNVNPYLEVLVYNGRVQLGTEDALYSDGRTYAPAVLACKDLKQWLPTVKNVLVMGVGLGSLVEVMYNKGYRPAYTLVELDSTILKMAMEHLGANSELNLEPVCADANQFIHTTQNNYDLIFVDIFQGRVVPDFVTTTAFLQACRQHLAVGGRLAMNYIENNPAAWASTLETFRSIFPNSKIIYHNINRIFIASA